MAISNPQDLIARYLQAVSFWLPRAQRQDIAAELAADIQSQMDDREAALDRPITVPEVEELLRRRGAPILVANGYLPQRSLIGPLLMPIYLLILRILALVCLIPSVVIGLANLLLSHSFWAIHSPSQQFQNFGAFWNAMISLAFTSIATTTLAFAVLEQVNQRTNFLTRWEPHRLPAVRNPHHVPRSGSAIQLAVSILFICWWIKHAPPAVNFPMLHVSLLFTSGFPWFFWGFLLVSLCSGAIAVAHLVHPYWTRSRAIINLIVDLLGSILFCALFRANPLAAIFDPDIQPGQSVAAAQTINHWLITLYPWCLLIAVITTGVNLYRIWRLNKHASA